MNLENAKQTISGYTQIKASPYGDYRSSKESIDVATKIMVCLEKTMHIVPETVDADGVILKYPRSINVEVGSDGDILVLDGFNNDYSFSASQIDQCADRVKQLLCQV